ncbi:MAG: AEC family transporter [Clostridia bacterium]|nr:AEC family transporter [Clostridia bacterium]
MGNTINTVLVFFIMIAAGFFLARANVLDEHASGKITKIVLWICVPSVMLVNVFEYFDPEMLKSAGAALLVPFFTVLCGWFLGRLVARLLRLPKNKWGVFAMIFTFSNTVFVGLPVNQALFGDAASVPALFYFLGNTVVFWTLGAWGVRMDAGIDAPFFSWKSLKAILSPSLVTLIISMIWLFSGIPVPTFLMQAAKKLGSPGTPLAMMIAGGVIYRGIKRGTWKRWEVIFSMMGKALILPLLALGFGKLFGLESFLSHIFISQAAMPTMSQSTIVAQNYGADDELASAASVVSMMGLLIIMPILSALFG